jgi:hypothetical protein
MLSAVRILIAISVGCFGVLVWAVLAIRNHLLDAAVRRPEPEVKPHHVHGVREAMSARLKDASRIAQRSADLLRAETTPPPLGAPARSYSSEHKAAVAAGSKMGAVDEFKEQLHQSEKDAVLEPKPLPDGSKMQVATAQNKGMHNRLDRLFYNEDHGDLSDPYESRH